MTSHLLVVVVLLASAATSPPPPTRCHLPPPHNNECSELANVTTLFAHGEDPRFPCVRSPSLLLAGRRLLAIVERWNYTGNHCYPRGIPPVANFSEEQAAFQDYAVRTSDDQGATWSPSRPLGLPILAWNLQTVYYEGATGTGGGAQGVVLIHIKEKRSGRIWQANSSDLGDTWGGLRDISSFFPPELIAPETGLRPSYGSGVIVPSDQHPHGRILMTGYDHLYPTNCHVYTSDNGGGTWQMASTIPDAFECGAAWLGGHSVYVNARNRDTRKPPPGVPTWRMPPPRRVQAISVHDGFKAAVNGSLGPLYEPSLAGALGGLTSLALPRPLSRYPGTLRGRLPHTDHADASEAEGRWTHTGGDATARRGLVFAIANGTAGRAPPPGLHQDQRYNLTVHYSPNEGREWRKVQVWNGYSGYAALAALDHTRVGVLWETGGANGCELACALTFGVIDTNTAVFLPAQPTN